MKWIIRSEKRVGGYYWSFLFRYVTTETCGYYIKTSLKMSNNQNQNLYNISIYQYTHLSITRIHKQVRQQFNDMKFPDLFRFFRPTFEIFQTNLHMQYGDLHCNFTTYNLCCLATYIHGISNVLLLLMFLIITAYNF